MCSRRSAVSTALGVSFVFCSLVTSGCGSEQERWEEAKGSGSLSAYEDFLSRHPDGVYADSARTQVQEIQFHAALVINTLDGYQEFLSHHPDGMYADSARAQLEQTELQQALAANTIEAYQEFLSRHGDGVYADSARAQIQQIGLQQALAANTIGAYQEFLSRYPEGRLADTVQKKLRGLYRSRAQRARGLQQMLYLRQPGRGELSNGDGSLVIREIVSGRLVTVDGATGDTIHATDLNARGNPSQPKVLCLDAAGTIVRASGRPVLLEPFTHEVFVVRGSQTYVQYDVYGRPEIEHSTLGGCADCVAKTGITNCVFVW